MTRETKIGLLVGLVFIILFGLILGERTNSLPEQAEKIPVRNNGNPFGGPPPAVALDPGHGNVTPAVAQESRPPIESGRPIMPGDPAPAKPAGSDTVGTPGALPPVPAAPVTGTAYTIEPSDTLIKIARKVYGEDNWRQYKKIYEANKDLLTSESANLTVGDKLIIPTLDVRPASTPLTGRATPAADGARSDIRTMSRDELLEYMRGTSAAERVTPATPSVASRGAYTTQRGDSLSSIARKKLGNDKPETLKKLFEANKDKLASPDQMKVGLTLTIPQ